MIRHNDFLKMDILQAQTAPTALLTFINFSIIIQTKSFVKTDAGGETVVNGYEAFWRLQQTDVYAPNGNEDARLRAVMDFWEKCADTFLHRFGLSGRSVNEGHGFGFLVEEIARRSSRFPRNTDKGNELERLILNGLQTGEGTMGIGARYFNPDIIWVRYTGRRAELCGIAEVKSSLSAYKKKAAQILYHEDNLRRMVEKLEGKKKKGTANAFVARRRLTFAKPFRKVLVVPGGKKQEFSGQFISNWECEEMEFSFQELLFLASQLWPEFTESIPRLLPEFDPAVGFGKRFLGRYAEEFVTPLTEWATKRFANIFEGSVCNPFPSWELLLFHFATGQLVYEDHEVEIVARGMREAGVFFTLPPAYLSLRDLKSREKKFFEKFIRFFGDSSESRNHILYFLHCLRNFKDKIVPWTRTHGVRAALQSVDENYEILAT